MPLLTGDGFGPHSSVMATKRKVVRMMFAVVLVFIVCWLPLLTFVMTKQCFLDQDGRLPPENEKVKLLVRLFNILPNLK